MPGGLNGPYSLGGFQGKGKGRTSKQRPSGDPKGCCEFGVAVRGLALQIGLVFGILLILSTGVIATIVEVA